MQCNNVVNYLPIIFVYMTAAFGRLSLSPLSPSFESASGFDQSAIEDEALDIRAYNNGTFEAEVISELCSEHLLALSYYWVVTWRNP